LTEPYIFNMIYSNNCVYLRDDTQSAALLAYHLPGGFHRLMNTSRYADWRTSSGFAQFRPEQSSVETAQSRRAVSGNFKTNDIHNNIFEFSFYWNCIFSK